MFVKEKIWVLLALMAGLALASDELVRETVFVAFDVETTGFSPARDRLVEIGAVRFLGDGTLLASTNWLVNPECPIPEHAIRVHGITDQMVLTSACFNAVWPAVEVFCSGAVGLAHNARFDVGFLSAALDRDQICTPLLPVVDTLTLFRKWFPQLKSHSLEFLSAELGVAGEVSHRAEADAVQMMNVFGKGMASRSSLTLQQLEQQAGGFNWLGERGH